MGDLQHTSPTDGVPGRLTDADGRPIALGAALRRAWIGYQRRLDVEIAAAGFDDRRLPDGRVLRLCAQHQALTASQIGRELGITRQGAAKIVTELRARGYIAFSSSPANAREKALTLTDRGQAYLAAHHQAARRIEQEVREQVGEEGLARISLLVGALGGQEDQPRLSDYLGRALRRGVTSDDDTGE